MYFIRKTIFSSQNYGRSQEFWIRFWVRFNPVSEIVHEYKWVPMALIFIKFLTSYAADKCNDREAAANQTLPPLCNWLQVRYGDIRWTFLSSNQEKTLKGAGWGCEWGPRALNERSGVQTQHSYQLRSELPCSWSWTLIPPETQGAREKTISASGANILDHKCFSSSHDFPQLHWCINRTQIQSVLFFCSSSPSFTFCQVYLW